MLFFPQSTLKLSVEKVDFFPAWDCQGQVEISLIKILREREITKFPEFYL